MGLTLKDIARRSGVSCRFLTDLEAGRGNISVVRLAHVAQALDVPMTTLFPIEEPETQTSQPLLRASASSSS